MYPLQLIKLMKNIFDYQNKNVWQVNSKGKICTFIMVASGNHLLSSYQTYYSKEETMWHIVVSYWDKATPILAKNV